MEKITITKEHFLEYLRWQRIGRFNMLDYNSWEPYTGLSRSAWFEIVYHYSDYHKKIHVMRTLGFADYMFMFDLVLMGLLIYMVFKPSKKDNA